ncbi:MAG TPA: Mur ligase domain-containing protein [Candidatus Saccharimonadales bacterium]|nr:Mur ligase domain-containing protein [Candidatus Saccharimonadales bacterium]
MNIYFSGIGGVGIGPLAKIAYDAGYGVTGSDPAITPITKELTEEGVAISDNQDGSFLRTCHSQKPIDWFIYTSALPADHPELALAHELGIKTAKRDELIAYIIDDKKLKLIAVAGTHGKTTVTGMLIWAMQQLDIPISYSIGTTISFGPCGKLDPKSEYFIYECDEFDRNFLHFRPYLSLITSVDYDHPDTYPTIFEYLDAFHQFAKGSHQIITWNDQHSELFNGIPGIIMLNPSDANGLSAYGQHNRRNITLVQAGLKQLGFDKNTDEIMTRFPGTNRRFEKLANNLYSDYGHHPVEIAATLQMARELSDHVVLVYQPHQNVRQYMIRDLYTDQFELADKVYWLPTYLSREDPNLKILEPKDLIQNITNKDDVVIADLNDELWDRITNALRGGALVICMGAGTIDGWLRNKLA